MYVVLRWPFGEPPVVGVLEFEESEYDIVTKDTLASEIEAPDIDKAARIQGTWSQRACGRRAVARRPEQSKRVSRYQRSVWGACNAAVGWVV